MNHREKHVQNAGVSPQGFAGMMHSPAPGKNVIALQGGTGLACKGGKTLGEGPAGVLICSSLLQSHDDAVSIEFVVLFYLSHYKRCFVLPMEFCKEQSANISLLDLTAMF